MPIDPHSATWAAVRRHAEQAIARDTEALINEHDHAQSMYLRGRIRALTELLALEADTSPPPISSPTYD